MTSMNATVVTEFWHKLWNDRDLDHLDRLVAPGLRWRGSLGTGSTGPEGLRQYMRQVLETFADFRCQIDELIDCGDRVVTRLTFTGRHQGQVFGAAPTGRTFSYPAVAILRLEAGLIAEAFVVGDTHALYRQLTE